MHLRWIIRNGEKVLQKLITGRATDPTWEDVPIEPQEKERKFKVGQVWKTRDGKHVTIVDIKESCSDPIQGEYCGPGLTYSKDGKYWGSHPHEYDLEELLSEGKEEKPEKKEPKLEGNHYYRFSVNGGNALTNFQLWGQQTIPMDSKIKIEAWVNVYNVGELTLHSSKKEAEEAVVYHHNRIACIKVTGVEGND